MFDEHEHRFYSHDVLTKRKRAFWGDCSFCIYITKVDAEEGSVNWDSGSEARSLDE